jgi:hypothetical protein
MSKVKADDLRPEYTSDELGKGVRGKYFREFQKGTNLVLISPDVARVFPDEAAVNTALRSLISVAQKDAKANQLSNEKTDIDVERAALVKEKKSRYQK